MVEHVGVAVELMHIYKNEIDVTSVPTKSPFFALSGSLVFRVYPDTEKSQSHGGNVKAS